MALIDVHRRQWQRLTPEKLNQIADLLGLSLPRSEPTIGTPTAEELRAVFARLEGSELRSRVLALVELLADP